MKNRDEVNLRPIIAAKLAERAGIPPESRLYAGFIDKAGDVIAAFRRQPRAEPVDEIDRLCAEVLRAEAEIKALRAARSEQISAIIAARTAPPEIDPSIRRLSVRDETTGKLVILQVPAEWAFFRNGTGQIVPL